MLTNVHNYILQEVLKKKKQNVDDISIYLYNVAPDALPLHKDISVDTTHKQDIPSYLLEKYPKLIYIKYHLLVDNLGHYNDINIVSSTRDNFAKCGYTYTKGKEIYPLVKKSNLVDKNRFSDNDIIYISHIIVEIATDYKLFQDNKSIANVFFEMAKITDKEILNEYYNALSELYKIDVNTIKQSRDEPMKFYKTFTSPDDFFLNKRSYLILRKLNKDFSDENVKEAVELIKIAQKHIDDYQSFLEFCVNRIYEIEDIENLKIMADQ